MVTRASQVIAINLPGGKTEVAFLEAYIEAPFLNCIDSNGKAFSVPAVRYRPATPQEEAAYWRARADAQQLKLKILDN